MQADNVSISGQEGGRVPCWASGGNASEFERDGKTAKGSGGLFGAISFSIKMFVDTFSGCAALAALRLAAFIWCLQKKNCR